MKKMYKQPVVEKAEMMPQSVICASAGTNPENVSSNIPGDDPIPVD